MFDNSITANKTMGVLTNHGTDSSNWNGNMIKNPINHAAYGQKNAKTVDWPSRWNLFSAKKIYIKICLSF